MKHGFIYGTVKFIFDKLNYLNLVEVFKAAAVGLTKDKNDKELIKANCRIGVDIFMISKWILLFMLWKLHSINIFIEVLVWYLLIANVYTYFYHHIWSDDALNTEGFPKDRIRRRFVSLLLSVVYSNVCFAYLYEIAYSSHFKWSSGVSALHALWYSVSNSLAANYVDVSPLTDWGNSISMIQLMITFTFITIIISRSIPATTSKI